MTIGIAVSGPRAGLALFHALAAVEQIARGAIGGFVSYAAISPTHGLLRAETQRGGTRTLFTAGETTGVLPPEPYAEATLAVLMSSGPDRPAPLSQFTPGDLSAGLITGHRLPNVPIATGGPLNLAVLDALAQGADVNAALGIVKANPEADAGVIAVGRDGSMALANTERVMRRDDIGSILLTDEASGLTVGVIHNAIFPVAPVALVAASAAIDAVAPADRSDRFISFSAGLPLVYGPKPLIHVAPDGHATSIEVDRDVWLGPRWDGAAIPRGAEVECGGATIGTIVFEPYCVAMNGQLVTMSGREAINVAIREPSRRA
ncbi:DUF6963 family protein [Acuticoccus kandeliae]|uniref:DUF6963 family protein n=1 Tax=Acuticoccus kandeliae TaxID=2073160 RepID=UPI000D3E5ACF|nr:hypothetical protein [Acuticoccus kandeliae]